MNLSTSYLGFDFSHPFVASASPLTGKPDTLRALEDAGAAAVVLPSVFEEELAGDVQAMDRFRAAGADTLAEAQSFFPSDDLYGNVRDRKLSLVRAAKEALEIPVIASLNGISEEGWTEFAVDLVAAGADAIELNLYHVGCNPDVSGADLEAAHARVVRLVREAVQVPLAVKLSPWFSSLSHFAARLEAHGADALVLFNRFYQPDLDPEELSAATSLRLSESRELLLPATWISILRPQIQCDLAATTGIHTPTDALKALAAGADAVMSTSALLRNGPGHLRVLREGVSAWLEEKGYESLASFKGCMSRERLPNPELFERTNYIKVLESFR